MDLFSDYKYTTLLQTMFPIIAKIFYMTNLYLYFSLQRAYTYNPPS